MQSREQDALVAVLMGVSGSGKTTIGKRLADRLGWTFLEGDSLHPPQNVEKMKAGHPLDDRDRAPWLAAVAAAVDAWRAHGEHGVVTCSALKRSYRRQIVGDRADVRLVYLEGSRALIAERLGLRRGHFMPANLLDSQFADLEVPDDEERPIVVSVEGPLDEIVERAATALRPRSQIVNH